MYYTVMMTEGTMKAIDSHSCYSDAELTYDTYCDKYPYAWIEIVSAADYDHCIALDNIHNHMEA